MKMKINLRTIAPGAMLLAFTLFGTASFAQQTQPSLTPNAAAQPGTWDSYKKDMADKYQNLTNQANDIRKQAADKKVTAQSFTDALSKFDAASKDFSDKWKNVDAITPDKMTAFKSDISASWDKLNSAFNTLQQEWAKVNK